MKTLLLILLVIHIASGFAALVCGGIAMFTAKGMKWHRRAGKVFFYAMLSVGITAFIISVFKDIWFLLMISVFALYLTITGYRALLFMRKTLLKPTLFDWLFLGVSLGFIGAISWLFFVRTPYSSAGMQPVLAVFNSIFLALLVKDFFAYRNFAKRSANKWLLTHIIHMMAAYIATITAFLVTNVHTNPSYIAWLAPTVVITPLIFYYIAKYRKKKTVAVA